MKGAFITNRYYTDKGTEYAFESLCRAFGDVPLIKLTPTLLHGGQSKCKPDFDFAIFWDKDFYLASHLGKNIPVFNNARTLEICDDKQKTYAALEGINYPKTVSAPLMYDVNDETDVSFVERVENELGFPLIVKENTGSQGRQVYKADSHAKLVQLYQKLKHIPHHYQQLVGEFGADLRIYTVGGKAVAACRRQGTDFRSNLGAGGTVSLVSPTAEYLSQAENISRQLNLDFGAVDFLIADKPTFLEVNSNAYFTGIEKLGVSIAEPIAAYILSKLNK